MKVDDRNAKSSARPRGMILVMAALLLVALLSFVALAVDIGVIATARAQLKTVTDSAALAGARQLVSDRRLSSTITNLDPEIALAISKAIEAGNKNPVLNQTIALSSSNVVVGYKNVSSTNSDPPDNPVNTTLTYPPRFNSVQVTVSVTVPILFSAAFRSSIVTVTSTATVELVKIQGFKSTNGLNASILPIVLSKVNYDRMMNGTGGDTFTFNPSTYNPPGSNGVAAGPDGVTESVNYPVLLNSSGNWGTINFGVLNNSTSNLSSQIRNGMTPVQILNEYPVGTAVLPHQFSGDTGISDAIKDDLVGIIGRSVTVPIYDQMGGGGTNAWYHIVAFASVRVVDVHMSGGNKYVVVQPVIGMDPTGIPDNSSPQPWTDGGMIYLHLSR